MTRKFIAAIVGAALTITAIGSAPARADEDLARALAAIVGIAIVGKVISDKLDDDDKKKSTVTRNRNTTHHSTRPYYNRSDNWIRRVEPRPLPRRVERRLLPGECLRSFNTRDGRYRIFGKQCLKRNYGYVKSLPRACEVKFRTGNKNRRGYGARCLRREGYQLARR